MKLNLIKLALLFVVLTAVLEISPKRPAHAVGVAPTITADPNPIIVPPGTVSGTTTLTWDGGDQHPYAEVWLKIDANDEKFVLEQGKGTKQFTIEVGKSYLFKLSDSNELLSSVTVTAKTQSSSPSPSPTSRNDQNGTILTSKNRHKMGSPMLPKAPPPKRETPPAPTTRSEIVRLDVLGYPNSGGDSFEYVCGPQRVLVGLRAYTGTMVDNVQAICARVGFQGLEDATAEGPVFGGANGNSNNGFSCPSQKIAAKLAVSTNVHQAVVGAITFACLDMFTSQWVDKGLEAGDPVHNPKDQACPPDTVAVGIRGLIRDGYVSGLGLICAGPTTP